MTTKTILTLIACREWLERKGYRVLKMGELEYSDEPHPEATDATDTQQVITLQRVEVERVKRRRKAAEAGPAAEGGE